MCQISLTLNTLNLHIIINSWSNRFPDKFPLWRNTSCFFLNMYGEALRMDLLIWFISICRLCRFKFATRYTIHKYIQSQGSSWFCMSSPSRIDKNRHQRTSVTCSFEMKGSLLTKSKQSKPLIFPEVLGTNRPYRHSTLHQLRAANPPISNSKSTGAKKTTNRWWFQTCYIRIYFTPIPGEMIQFDGRIFFKWVETTN